MFSISLSLISIGILSAASGFYFAIPSESELANSQTPEIVFDILVALRICMVSAVLGGLLQLYNFGGYGIRILSATNKRFQSDANFSRTWSEALLHYGVPGLSSHRPVVGKVPLGMGKDRDGAKFVLSCGCLRWQGCSTNKTDSSVLWLSSEPVKNVPSMVVWQLDKELQNNGS